MSEACEGPQKGPDTLWMLNKNKDRICNYMAIALFIGITTTRDTVPKRFCPGVL